MEAKISKSFVIKMLREAYGIVPDSVEGLCSYFNVNYLVTTKNEGSCQKFVVKIFNTSNPSYFGNAQLQHNIMLHVNNHGLPSSVPLISENKQTFVKAEFGGDIYFAQVLNFLEGKSVQNASLSAIEMEDIGFHVGRFLGQFHLSLEDFIDDISLPTSFPFYAENAALFLDKIDYVSDPRIVRLITEYMKRFQENFLSRLNELRKGYIHGDFSSTNVIIKRSKIEENRGKWDVSGVVDFEHCHHGYLVGDLGICIAYFMMKSAATPGSNPISVAKEITRGYESVIQLTISERDVLLDAIVSRICVSYLSSSYESFLRPHNKEYICLHRKSIQILFDILESSTPSNIKDILFSTE